MIILLHFVFLKLFYLEEIYTYCRGEWSYLITRQPIEKVRMLRVGH
jgi:hypothetical protein